MKKKWTLILFTAAIITTILACNLPGSVSPPPATDTPSQPPPADPPVEQPDPEDPPEPEEPADPEEPEEPAEPEEPPEPADSEEGCTPDSEFIDDITIPDGSLINPGATITKTWRVRNDGACTWTGEYVWEQLNFGDSKLKASMKATPLPTEVAPGQTYDISVELTLDGGVDIGTIHTARFQMRSPEGDLFGTHPFSTIFASPGTGICPIGTSEQRTFINAIDRFCFLYPKDYEAYIGATSHTIARHPLTPGVLEEIVAMVSVAPEGSTGGMNTVDWANHMVNLWKAPATTPTVVDVTIGGMTGRQTDELPGMVGNRIAFLVHNGKGYVFTVLPYDDAFATRKQQAIELWDMVRGDFTFFGP